MKMIARLLLIASINFLLVAEANSEIVVFTSLGDWQEATENVVTENFEDDDLVSGLSVVTDNGSISGGVWNDTVDDPLLLAPAATTTWTYNNAPAAWSTDIDLTPGGGGSGLDVVVTYTDLTTESLGTIDTSGFLGIVVTENAISQIEFSTSALLGITQEEYALDNFASGFAVTTTAVPEPCGGTLLSLVGVMLAASRRRRTAG